MQKNVPFTERELFKQPLSAVEIRELLGDRPASDLISTKSPRYKAMGLADREISDEERISLMAQEPYLIRRPTFKIGQELVVGMDSKRLDALIPSEPI